MYYAIVELALVGASGVHLFICKPLTICFACRILMIWIRILQEAGRRTRQRGVIKTGTGTGRRAGTEIGNAIAIVEIVIGTVAENVMRKGNVREMISMMMMTMIITEVDTVTGTYSLLLFFFLFLSFLI